MNFIYKSVITIFLMSCNNTAENLPKNIDHLVYTASSLEEGIVEIERILGVKAVRGGRHPNYGTHNALLSLGDSIYLEIIAPDPGLPVPERGRLLADSYKKSPRLSTWVLRTDRIENLHATALKNGLKLGNIASGKREKPDGSVLAWQLSDPYAFPLEGTIPFLIDWGNTPHPATTLPNAGTLTGIEIQHPDPGVVRNYLNILGVSIKVIKGQEPGIRAKIKTAKGIVLLE